MKKARRLLLVGLLVTLISGEVTGVAGADSGRSVGTLTVVAGSVSVKRAPSAPQPLKPGDRLFWRDVVTVGKDSIARFVLGGKITVTVRELSRVELREEVMAEGVRYTVELISGKVRASVARMLMRPGEQAAVRTRNAVASVRGTDFIVETREWRPAPVLSSGLLGVPSVTQGLGAGGVEAVETGVVTLSGLVEVSNQLGSAGRVGRIGALEAVRVSGSQDPTRLEVPSDELKVHLKGLTLAEK